MPLEIILHKKITLDDTWLNKDNWDNDMNRSKEGLVELLNEDITSFIEDECGGIGELIKSMEWVE